MADVKPDDSDEIQAMWDLLRKNMNSCAMTKAATLATWLPGDRTLY
jgi:hypothetical protein